MSLPPTVETRITVEHSLGDCNGRQSFVVPGSGLRYRSGRGGGKANAHTTVGADSGMEEERKENDSLRERHRRRQADGISWDIRWDDYDPCASCGKGRGAPVRVEGYTVLCQVVCCPS